MAFDRFFFNAEAKDFALLTSSGGLQAAFHSQLPDFQETPLVPVPGPFGVDRVFVKDESLRIGLPSFKILGASWGTFRAIANTYNLPLDASIDSVRETAQAHCVHLVTATDGNHGRAIARMANLLGAEATIFIPDTVGNYTRELIRNEGAAVNAVSCDYDKAVAMASQYANQASNRLLVQDTSFENYYDIPSWIVQGYATMFDEIESQLGRLGLKATHIITPVGVGSLAHAVVTFCKSDGRMIKVIAVESAVAACLQKSLRNGEIVSISTGTTIMEGINCGTVSDISWPVLRQGIDGAITISDQESVDAIQILNEMGIRAGPCGASTTAGLRKLQGLPDACLSLGIDEDSVIVLLNTEGPREFVMAGKTIRIERG